MSFFQQILAPRRGAPPDDSGETLPTRMNLEERMVFRRDLMFECIGAVMSQNGFPDSTYRLRVVRTDQRGHSFAVMIDVSGSFLKAEAATSEALGAIGCGIVARAKSTGLILVVGVYWSVGQDVEGMGARQSRAVDRSMGDDRPRRRIGVDSRSYATDVAPLSES